MPKKKKKVIERYGEIKIPLANVAEAVARGVFETIPAAMRGSAGPVPPRKQARLDFAQEVLEALRRKPTTAFALILTTGKKPGVVFRAIRYLKEVGRIEEAGTQKRAKGVVNPEGPRPGPKPAIYRVKP